MRSRFVAIVVAGSLTLALGSASAATIEYESFFTKLKLSEKSEGSTYSGRVGSTKKGCVKKRKVKVMYKRGGETDKIGSARTDKKGKFRIEISGGSLERGKYYAIAKKRSYKRGGNKVVCEKAESRTLKV
jgi:hypothetical protein